MATLAAGDGRAAIPGDAPPALPAARRIEALDFVRGVALFGILLMNITGFGLPDAYFNPTNSGGAEDADLWAWLVTQIGFEGTQRALFSMLFGASVILLTSRLEASGRSDSADIYFRRNLWLIALGFVNAFGFLWYGDILYAYGVTALFVFAFRNMAPRRLLTIGVGALLLGAVWNASDTIRLLDANEAAAGAIAARDAGAALTEEQEGAIAAWDDQRSQFESSPERIDELTEAHTSGWWLAFRHVAVLNSWWQSWGMYRFFFDIFGMMLIGMAFFRLGVLTLERPTGVYALMMAGGYSVGLAVNVIEARWIMDHQFSAVAFAQTNISYDLGRLAMTVGHVGALLLFVRSGWLPRLRRAMAAVGQMAVTNYLAHSIVCGFLFIGLGWYGQLQRHELYYVVLAIWAVQLVISPLWLKHYRFGPVEWLWRYLTYLKRPPWRRTEASAAAAAAA